MKLLPLLLLLVVSCNRARTVPTTKENPKDQLTYVWIEPGTFMMGCSPGDNECRYDEKPTHQVTITKGFWIGETEVTQAAYERITGKTPSRVSSNNLMIDMPVENVSWDDAQAYCRAIGMRLPTEAEWEYAARGGNASSRYGKLNDIAWYSGNAIHHEGVAQKRPNRFGLFDMLGNVLEWTSDWYDANYYGERPITDPQGPPKGQERVTRGGGIANEDIRVSCRNHSSPNESTDVIGFRCAGT